MNFTPKEECIFWTVALSNAYVDDVETLVKELEVYRLEKFPTITKEELLEIMQHIDNSLASDINKIFSRLRNGN